MYKNVSTKISYFPPRSVIYSMCAGHSKLLLKVVFRKCQTKLSDEIVTRNYLSPELVQLNIHLPQIVTQLVNRNCNPRLTPQILKPQIVQQNDITYSRLLP